MKFFQFKPVTLALLASMLVLTACAISKSNTPTRSLTGIEWQLIEADGHDAPKDPSGSKPASLRFEPPSNASGYSGVNNFNGSFISKDDSLKFGPVVMTRRAGPPEDMAVESAMMTALEGTRSYRISGNTLELLDATGKPLARFEAAEN